MSDFNPGPGWREITEREWLQTPIDSDIVDFVSGGRQRRWVRESPVPPLPTAPYSVIRVTWAEPTRGHAVLLRSGSEDKWSGMGYSYDSLHLADDITRFEVLSEPRAVTAKAVIQRFIELRQQHAFTDAAVVELAGEFGADS